MSRRPSIRTGGDVLRWVGRTVLWALVLMLLARGLGDLLARDPVAARVVKRATPAVWPDDEARAFGAAFARAYFTVSSRDPGTQARALASFVPAELVDSIAPAVDERSGGSSVAAVVFVRAAAVDWRHALLTYAVTVGDGTRYLTVPVARDERGGLVVDELPSLAAPPRVASLPVPQPESVTGAERDELAGIVERFLRAYVVGDAGALAYLVPAGVRIATPGPRGYAFVELVSLAQARPPAGRVRDLEVTVRVRELGTGVVFTQLYRLRLERRERWYVADVNGSREG